MQGLRVNKQDARGGSPSPRDEQTDGDVRSSSYISSKGKLSLSPLHCFTKAHASFVLFLPFRAKPR